MSSSRQNPDPTEPYRNYHDGSSTIDRPIVDVMEIDDNKTILFEKQPDEDSKSESESTNSDAAPWIQSTLTIPYEDWE